MAEMLRLEAIETVGKQTRLTQKGHFIIRSNLSTHVAAFLYEASRLGVQNLACIAATVLENHKSPSKNMVLVVLQSKV